MGYNVKVVACDEPITEEEVIRKIKQFQDTFKKVVIRCYLEELSKRA